MKFKKKDLNEIIDSNGELIGNDNIPKNDANAETQASNTTDYNAKVGTQPFRYDMLGRFGFTLMPFMEGKEENQGQKELIEDVSKELFNLYKEILEYYYRNPNLIKSEFRQLSDAEKNKESVVNGYVRDNFNKYSKKIVSVFQNHFENAFNEPENIDESKVVEDKMIDKKTEDEISKKSDNSDIKDKKLQKVAGLINKLDKKDIDKLINLLERK